MSKKVYLVGPSPELTDEYLQATVALRQAGYEVIGSGLQLDSPDLRIEIALLTTCDAICLLDAWWTSREAHCLQTIAAWLRFEVVDAEGAKIPTLSLRG